MSDKSHRYAVHDIRYTAKHEVQDAADYLVTTAGTISATAAVHGEFNQEVDLGFDESQRLWEMRVDEFQRKLNEASDRLEDYAKALRRCADHYEETTDDNLKGIDNIFAQEKAEDNDTG